MVWGIMGILQVPHPPDCIPQEMAFLSFGIISLPLISIDPFLASQ